MRLWHYRDPLAFFADVELGLGLIGSPVTTKGADVPVSVEAVVFCDPAFRCV